MSSWIACNFVIDQFSIECRKPKPKLYLLWPITDNPVIQSKREAYTCSGCKAREEVCEWVTICMGFSSDLMRKWRDLFKLITKRCYAKPMEPLRITIDTKLKPALKF